MTGKKPWDIFQQLQSERLHTLGAILKDVRRKALMIYDPEEGDGPWCSECTIYQRTLNTFIRYSKILPWLRIQTTGLYFVIFVDGVPIRYYKGDVEKPKKNSLNIRTEELIPHEQLCLIDPENFNWYWRMVLIPDENRMASEIAIAQYHDQAETYRNLWFFDQNEISLIHLVTSSIREAAVLAPAPLGILPDFVADERDPINGNEN
jgi:hypothetical protein